jgi:selenocysteine lyase/cysteine desulfurase
MKECESNTLEFYVKKLNPYLNSSIKKLSNYVNCSTDDIVFIENATTAFNTLVKSFNLKKDDKFLCKKIFIL